LIFIAVAIDQPFFWNVERNESAFEQKILDGGFCLESATGNIKRTYP